MADLDKGGGAPELSIIVVNYKTAGLAITAVRSVVESGPGMPYEIILWDNSPADTTPDEVAEIERHARYVPCEANVGFAEANNRAIEQLAAGEWVLLLNPDTEIQGDAIDAILRFAIDNPGGGVYGGRTVFPDGSLNIASCWGHQSLWSLFCRATMLTTLMPGSALFNPEGYGSWQRDTVRRVGIVVGCFLLMRRELWDRLGGFDTSYWMYGEEADLCIRAQKLGYTPMVTPDAQIMHLVGASSDNRASKAVQVAKAKATLVRRHWGQPRRAVGLSLMLAWALNRRVLSEALGVLSSGRFGASRDAWREVWRARRDWLGGYPRSEERA